MNRIRGMVHHVSRLEGTLPDNPLIADYTDMGEAQADVDEILRFDSLRPTPLRIGLPSRILISWLMVWSNPRRMENKCLSWDRIDARDLAEGKAVERVSGDD